MNTATTASKRVIQKTAEVAGDLIGNKMAKSKKKKKMKDKKFIYQQKNDSKLLMT